MNFLKNCAVMRFPSCRDRANARSATLADYLDAVTSHKGLPPTKDAAPAWALCNGTGTADGKPNGLTQLDFDHVGDVEGLRRALAAYGGFLAVVRTWSGHGLVAIGDVGRRIAADRDALRALVYAPLRGYLEGLGFIDGVDYTLDEACAKPCQLRFESRDPHAWVSPAPARLAVDPDDPEPLNAHPIAWLAEALRPGGVSPAGLAAAVACVSMAADLRSRMTPRAPAYPARAFCVLIGDPGTRKTTLLGAVQDIARTLGVTVSDPKNAPTLREHILACGCDEVTELPASGKGQPTKRLVARVDAPADPLMVCIDEAGQRLRTRVQDESCGSMAAMLRLCNADRVTLEGTVKQSHKGSFRVPAHVTAMLATTPGQWAEYVGALRQTEGEARRMIELWQDAGAGDMFAEDYAAPDLDTATDLLRRLREMGALWRDSGTVFTPDTGTHGAFRALRAWLMQTGVDAPSADSLVMTHATLVAAARACLDGHVAITAHDLAATAALLRLVVDARARLAGARERAEAAAHKPDSAVWAELTEWIGRTPRRDKLMEKIARRPPQYRRVFDEMRAQGAVVVERDASGKYVVRHASAREIVDAGELAEERRAAVREETEAMRSARAVPYAECTEAEREERVLAYYAKWRGDNALTEGCRNVAINKLVYSLQSAGMWDDAAKTVVETVSANCGLEPPEIRALMRERKKIKTREKNS